MQPYKPTKRLTYWCDKCDDVLVKSTNPITGKFYVQEGQDYTTDMYTRVIFALCPKCDTYKDEESADD